MLEFINFLSKRFFIFGGVAVFGIFVIIFSLGAYDLARNNKLNKNQMGALISDTKKNTTQESASEAAKALIGDSNLSDLFKKNTTEGLAENISKEIIAKNPTGPGAVGSQKLSVPDPAKIVNDYIQKGVDGFNYESLKPLISDAEIKIIKDSKSEDLQSYILFFFKILSKPIEAPTGNDPRSSISMLIRIYNDYISELYALPTPKIFSELHKKQISLLVAEKNIYELIQNYEEDPLKALIATQSLQAIKIEIAEVYTDIIKIGIENGAKI